MGKIDFEAFTLGNGLKVIVHEDPSTPLACLNVMYDVGSRDEQPEHTGFAHLFEHLMFGGSVNIPSYDGPLQEAGGSNNAFTSTDLTNYYAILPSENLETAFWLESDRMLNLAFNPTSLEVQRNVVIEEFKQRYLNQPYGDAWLLMRPLAYEKHPYRWPTIGQEAKHIEEATMSLVKNFYQEYYRPKNAVVVVAGNVKVQRVKELSEKWFEPIVKGEKPLRELPKEPKQKQAKRILVERAVPLDAIYTSFHMCGRSDADYHTWDLISDVLSGGLSGRLQQRLVKEKRIFTTVSAFVMGERDPSLFTIAGHISNDRTIEEAESEIWNEIQLLENELIGILELEKVKNQIEANHEFAEMSLLNRAIGLAYHDLMGNLNAINQEIEQYHSVSRNDILRVAKSHLTEANSSTLIYRSVN